MFPAESQDAFLAGHVATFEVFGGVPVLQIRYDNLIAAVNKVLTGRGLEEQVRWSQFRSHYGFDAFYCMPGVGGAREGRCACREVRPRRSCTASQRAVFGWRQRHAEVSC